MEIKTNKTNRLLTLDFVTLVFFWFFFDDDDSQYTSIDVTALLSLLYTTSNGVLINDLRVESMLIAALNCQLQKMQLTELCFA